MERMLSKAYTREGDTGLTEDAGLEASVLGPGKGLRLRLRRRSRGPWPEALAAILWQRVGGRHGGGEGVTAGERWCFGEKW
ncbi:hypothetical protein ABZP36_026412 [Zizania latifolia]